MKLMLFTIIISLGASLANAAEDSASEIRFTRDVLPVITKLGCNSGACHGSFQGRGGLRLSLWGDDPAADYDSLTKEARGRRVSPAFPADSLLLRKPSGRTPHGGGLVLPPRSASYRTLHQWIEAGSIGPHSDDPTIERIDVVPREIVLNSTSQSSLRVVASWSDGVTRDVSKWAVYESGDSHIAAVDKAGTISAAGRGRTAITVRYAGTVQAVTVTVPFARIENFPQLPQNNYIDELVEAEWKKVGVLPAELCDDATFLRRTSLDLTGTLPTPDQVREFIASSQPDKRSRLIDSLLASSEYVDLWSLRWADMLRAQRRDLGIKGLASFQTWLHTEMRRNVPADLLVRQLLLAKGNMYKNGPVAFYFVDKTPADLAETTAQIFLGVRMQCARCHHHPFESWSQQDYYGLAAFFGRVKRKDTKEAGRFGGGQAILIADSGSVKHPGSGEVVLPQFPGQNPLETTDAGDPRQQLADWILDRENPFFAKNIANRYWGFLFGRGLVHPIDDLRDTNPAIHPALLAALADDFAEHKYDLKHLLRRICNSRVYQLQAEVAAKRDRDGLFLTHHVPHRLPAEVLLDAVNEVVGVSATFPDLPKQMRAIELPDPTVRSDFLDIFGRARRNTTCVCDRSNAPDLRQALHLTNNDLLQKRIAAKTGRVAKLVASKSSDEQCLDELYLAALSRFPDAEEKRIAQEFLTESTDRTECLEDLLWTLINSAEFSFSR